MKQNISHLSAANVLSQIARRRVTLDSRFRRNDVLAIAVACVLLLSGCGAPIGLAAWEAGGIYETRPDDLPPADTATQMGQHESWCYHTLGTIECYDAPQDTPPGRLVNVDPPNRYPLNRKAYAESLEQNQQAEAARDAAKIKAQQAAMAPVSSQPELTPAIPPMEMTPIPPQSLKDIPPPPKSKMKPKTKKHKKKKAAKAKPVTPEKIPN